MTGIFIADLKPCPFWERVEMCRELDELARAALENKHG